MPILALAPAAATAFWGSVAAGTAATASLVGGKMQANAARDAAGQQVTAANHAADVQGKAAADTLAFQKQQSAYDAQTAETNRRANYDQWSGRQSQLGSVGEALGLPSRAIPAYVPLPASPYDSPAQTPGMGAPSVGSALAPPPGPGGPVTPGAPSGNPQAYFDSVFPGETLTPDMLIAKEADLNKNGITLIRNAAGIPGKIQIHGGPAVDVIQGAGSGLNRKQWTILPGPGAVSASKTPYTTQPPTFGSVGDALAFQNPPVPVTGTLPLPKVRYQAGSVGSYL